MTVRTLYRTTAMLVVAVVVARSSAGFSADAVSAGVTLGALEHAVNSWRDTGKTPAGFPLDLSGLNFVWRASPGNGSQVVAVSKLNGGYLALFGQSGQISDLKETGEIYASMFLCDFDKGRVPEVIIDVVVSSGTGVLRREFQVFSIKQGSLAKLGAFTSYLTFIVVKGNGDWGYKVTKGYVRCDPGDGMQTAGLAYLQEVLDETGTVLRSQRSSFQVQNGALVERPAGSK